MPRMTQAIYATHMDSVLKLAAAKGGVSRNQIVNDLNVTYSIAAALIGKCELTAGTKVGRTQFYVTNGAPKVEPSGGEDEDNAKPEAVAVKRSRAPAAVKAATVPKNTSAAADAPDDSVAELDAQIIDTRQTLRAAAAKAGKALGEWATHQALVDALRERMTDLATRRMNAS